MQTGQQWISRNPSLSSESMREKKKPIYIQYINIIQHTTHNTTHTTRTSIIHYIVSIIVRIHRVKSVTSPVQINSETSPVGLLSPQGELRCISGKYIVPPPPPHHHHQKKKKYASLYIMPVRQRYQLQQLHVDFSSRT
jgi:hypothetical protein